jgi:hypothetical protein
MQREWSQGIHHQESKLPKQIKEQWIPADLSPIGSTGSNIHTQVNTPEMNHTKITFKYLGLLAKAEETDNRKEAISLINQATDLLNRENQHSSLSREQKTSKSDLSTSV